MIFKTRCPPTSPCPGTEAEAPEISLALLSSDFGHVRNEIPQNAKPYPSFLQKTKQSQKKKQAGPESVVCTSVTIKTPGS